MASPTYSPPSDSMTVFIAAVNQRLESLSISKSELARRTEMDQSYLNKLLKGEQGNCTLTKCDIIASALGTTTGELLVSVHS